MSSSKQYSFATHMTSTQEYHSGTSGTGHVADTSPSAISFSGHSVSRSLSKTPAFAADSYEHHGVMHSSEDESVHAMDSWPPKSARGVTGEAAAPFIRSKSVPVAMMDRQNSRKASKLTEFTSDLHTKFSDFVQGISELTDQDTNALKHEMQQHCLNVVREHLDQEAEERAHHVNHLHERFDKHDTLADNHNKMIDKLQDRVSRLESDLQRVLKETMSEKSVYAKEMSSMKQRIETLESVVGDSHNKHTREVEHIRSTQSAFAKELDALREDHEQHLATEESLDAAVKGLTSAAEQTAKALGAARTKLDHMHESVTNCEQHCQATESRSQTLVERSKKELQQFLADRTKEMEKSFDAALRDRVADLDAIRRDLPALSDEVKRRHGELGGLINKRHSELSSMISEETKTREKKLSEQATILERQLSTLKAGLDDLERKHTQALNDHLPGQARELKAFKDEQVKYAQDLKKALDSTHARLDELHRGVLGCEERCAAADTKYGALSERAKKDLERALGDRATALERKLEGILDGHSADLHSMRSEHSALADEVKQKYGDLGGLINQRDGDFHNLLNKHHGDLTNRLKDEARAREKQIGDHVESLEEHVNTLQKHLQEAERKYALALGNRDEQAREIKALKEELVKYNQESQKLLASTRSRLDHLDEGIQGSEEQITALAKCVKDLEKLLPERTKEFERRLESALHGHSLALEGLRGDHASLSDELRKRHGDLNSMINDRHGDLNNMLKNHYGELGSKIAEEAKAREKRIAQQEKSFQGSLSEVERKLAHMVGSHDDMLKSLRDGQARHSDEIGAARTNLDNAIDELQVTRDELDQVLALLAGVQKAWRGCTKTKPQTPKSGRRGRGELSTPKTPKSKAGYEVSSKAGGYEMSSNMGYDAAKSGGYEMSSNMGYEEVRQEHEVLVDLTKHGEVPSGMALN